MTIESVMDAIERQVIHNGARPGGGGEAALVDDGSAMGVLLSRIEQVWQRRGTDPGYRIQSHRPIVGVPVNWIKRVIHWGSRPYTDSVRGRQEEFNEAVWGALVEAAGAIEELRGELGEQVARLEQLQAAMREEEAKQHERTLAREAGLDERIAEIEARDDLGEFYGALSEERRLELMDETRGPYGEIKMRQAPYVKLFEDVPGQVLDVGCGRGELIGMMRIQGIECWGADMDPLMVELCRKQGNHAVQMGALEVLESVPAASLGGVIALQVVEHLYPGELLRFLRLARRQMARGGVLLLETLNPASLGVLAKSYYRDLDHKQPIHPEHMKSLVELAGFEEVALHYSAPYNEEERPEPLPPAGELGLTPQAHAALTQRMDKLESWLFGMQDYYVVARQGEPMEAAEKSRETGTAPQPRGDA